MLFVIDFFSYGIAKAPADYNLLKTKIIIFVWKIIIFVWRLLKIIIFVWDYLKIIICGSLENYRNFLLSSIRIQLINGSPVYLFSHVQIGLWLITVQREFCLAHGEISLHGFLHFWSIQDLSWSQSEPV